MDLLCYLFSVGVGFLHQIDVSPPTEGSSTLFIDRVTDVHFLAEASEVTSYVTGLYKAGIPNVAVLLGGVNDIQVGGRTAAQLQADATTWATAVKAAGFKALIGTLYPRAVTGGYTAAMETVRVAHNAWIRANSGPSLTFDDYVDFELEPTFLPTISSADFPDNLHPGLAGYRKADPILADAILRNMPGI